MRLLVCFIPEKWEDKTPLPYFQSLRPYSISLKAEFKNFLEWTWCTFRELAVLHVQMVVGFNISFQTGSDDGMVMARYSYQPRDQQANLCSFSSLNSIPKSSWGITRDRDPLSFPSSVARHLKEILTVLVHFYSKWICICVNYVYGGCIDGEHVV